MKKFLLLTLLCLSCVASYAAQLTATLQSGDKLTPFYGDNSFVEAYEAAVDGDIITLSPGNFKTMDINKSVTVIGAYAFSTKAAEATIMDSSTVIADDVTLEGIRFTKLTIKGADNLTISRCWMSTLADVKKDDHVYHDNTIVYDSLIESCESMSYSTNAVFKNCCINHFDDFNSSANPALIEKCNIPHLKTYYDPEGLRNFNYHYYIPYAIYRNCFLGFYLGSNNPPDKITFLPPSEFHDNIFYRSYYSKFSSSYFKSWDLDLTQVVDDNNDKARSSEEVLNASKCLNMSSFDSFTHTWFGETYGPYGPQDHKSYPAIPVITSSEIGTETDAEGNLHVKINANARD